MWHLWSKQEIHQNKVEFEKTKHFHFSCHKRHLYSIALFFTVRSGCLGSRGLILYIYCKVLLDVFNQLFMVSFTLSFIASFYAEGPKEISH